MKKKNIFIYCCIFGGSCILVHFYLLLHFLNPNTNNKHILANLQDVARIGKKHKVLVFIIEPQVLKGLNNGYAAKDPECQLLCLENKLTTLAIIEHQGLDFFISDLEKIHFQIYSVQGPDPRLNGILTTMKVPLHLFLLRENHVIQLVVFYERVGNFLWHGSINPKSDAVKLWENVMPFHTLKFGRYPGSFNKMEIFPAVIDNIHLHAPVRFNEFLNELPTSRFIGCDYERADRFYKFYGKDTSEGALLFRQLAKKVILKGKKILDDLGIKFWLSSGTCLGWFRQCDIIPYSKDADFGIFIKDYDLRLISTFSVHNLPLKHLFGKVDDSFELSFQSGEVKLDIFFFYEESNYTWNGGTQARTGKKFKYIFPPFSLCWTEFLEIKVRIPCETQSYIEANYGQDWLTPVQEWDWKKSPSNVLENGQWPVETWTEVIQLF